MSHAIQHPMLRLVGARVDETRRVLPLVNAQESRTNEESGRTARVAAENARAARLSDHDARWILAKRTADMLEGAPDGPVARLRPERRRNLHDLATRLGLRSFDANLVIAVVQDAAVHEGSPLSDGCRERLTLVTGAAASKRSAANVDAVRAMARPVRCETGSSAVSLDARPTIPARLQALASASRPNAPSRDAAPSELALNFGISVSLAAIAVLMLCAWIVR